MRITTENPGRNRIVFTSFLLMIVCLFISRGALSVSMILFFAATMLHRGFLHQFRNFYRNRLLLAMSGLFLIPLVSGLWSSNLQEWSEILRIKTPLLLFPIAFAGEWKFTKKEWRTAALVFLGALLAGCCWSLVQYLGHMEQVHEGYLRSGTINTPMENDHVRFSWLVSAGVVLCFMGLKMEAQRWWKVAHGVLAAFFIAYLHILSARTGLLALYLFLFIFGAGLLTKGRPLRMLAFAAGAVTLPLLAFLLLPTFQNRWRYFEYDFFLLRTQAYTPGSNDGVRFQSIKAGWATLQHHPLGAGAGDLRGEVDAWYAQHVPTMPASEKFLPCNEWLVYGGFAGWPGVLLFTAIVALPFFWKPVRHRLFWIALNVMAISSFVFDMGIEAQYGVFIYGFVILWWWKWFKV